jgi:hypothetical protein
MKKPLLPKTYKKRIRAFISGMRTLFDLLNFDIEVRYFTEDHKEDQNVRAEVVFSRSYRRVTICIFPPFYKLGADEQREVLLHELSHTFTDRLAGMVCALRDGKLVTEAELREANEEATSRITTLIRDSLMGQGKSYRKVYAAYVSPLQKKKKR